MGTYYHSIVYAFVLKDIVSEHLKMYTDCREWGDF